MSLDRTHHQPIGDLDTPAEVETMVRRFYGDVAQDALLGPLFNDVAQVNWAEHVPKLTGFWCRALLGIQGYSGNPFAKHKAVHAEHNFTAAHFQRWLELFFDTLELGWRGPNVERAKQLAIDVARVHSKQLIGESFEWVDGDGDASGDSDGCGDQ